MRRARHDRRGWGVLGVCLAVVAGLTLAGQRVADATANVSREVGVGERAPLREYDLRADRIDLARAVDLPAGDGVSARGTTRLVPHGVFVVVRWTASRASSPVTAHEPRLVAADGRTYAPRVGTGEPVSGRLVQPGFVLGWTSVFDIPPYAVPGARLVVRPGAWETPLYDAVAVVRLGPATGEDASPVVDVAPDALRPESTAEEAP